MTNWAVLGAGPSLNLEDVNYVRDKAHVVVCNNAYKLAPWADVLVACDQAWWNAYPEAHAFGGEKFSPKPVSGVNQWIPQPYMTGWNTGLYGMLLARARGATRIILLGFDMHSSGGTHFFGDHPKGLNNPNTYIFQKHLRQFESWPGGLEVVNCTPHTALKRFRCNNLRNELNESAPAKNLFRPPGLAEQL